MSSLGRRGLAPCIRFNRVWLGAMALLWFGMLVPATASAQAPFTVTNVRYGFGDRVKNGAWTPLWLQVQGGAERFQGEVEATVPDDDDVVTAVRQPVDIPANQERTITIYVRPGNASATPPVRLGFRDERRRRVYPHFPEDAFNKIDMNPTVNDVLIATVGDVRGPEAIAQLPEFVPPQGANQQASHSILIAPATLPGGLPRDWRGYDSVDLLILDASNEDAMKEFRASGEAIRQWVMRGGHLAVAVGTNWTSVRDSILVQQNMLPAVPTGTITINEFGALEKFAGATTPLAPTNSSTLVAKLEIPPGRQAAALDETSAGPLVARGAYGFGIITVIAMDVSAEPFASWKGRALFWVKAGDIRKPNIGAFGGRAFVQPDSTDFSSTLRTILDQFPGVRLVPFGWVAFFIFIYILLIGPGDYFFLKKVVKRMELTWITFPATVAIVSMIAYYSAYAIKGRDLLVNKIDVIDFDQQAGQVRGFTWMNIFSPENHDYDIRLLPAPVHRDLKPDEAAQLTADTPKNSDDTMLTWFGKSETGFGGANNSNRLGFSTHSYSYRPDGDSRSLEGVRVAMWSSKPIYGRWFGSSSAKLIDAGIRDDGNGRLTGSIANVSERKLIGPKLIYGGYVYEVPDLEPGASAAVDSVRTRLLKNSLDEASRAFTRYYNPGGFENSVLQRRPVMTALMFNGLGDEKNRQLTNGSLRDVDLTRHVEFLNRPMLIAEVQGPGAVLDLGRAPSVPKIAQSSLIRVILSLSDQTSSAPVAPAPAPAPAAPAPAPAPAPAAPAPAPAPAGDSATPKSAN